KQTGESLVRLDATGRGRLGGRDIEPSLADKNGLFACVAGPLRHDWDYLQRTSCQARSGARVSLPLPRAADFTHGATLIVRLRRAAAPEPSELSLSFAGHACAPRAIDGSWVEQRCELEPAWLRAPEATLSLHAADSAAVIALDHALVV